MTITGSKHDLQEEIEFDFTKSKNIDKLGYVDIDDDEDDMEPVPKKKSAINKEVEENIELMYELKKKNLV